jgi:hypothetical protein
MRTPAAKLYILATFAKSQQQQKVLNSSFRSTKKKDGPNHVLWWLPLSGGRARATDMRFPPAIFEQFRIGDVWRTKLLRGVGDIYTPPGRALDFLEVPKQPQDLWTKCSSFGKRATVYMRSVSELLDSDREQYISHVDDGEVWYSI